MSCGYFICQGRCRKCRNSSIIFLRQMSFSDVATSTPVYAATTAFTGGATAAADAVLSAALWATRRRVPALQPPLHARRLHRPDARLLGVPQRHAPTIAAAVTVYGDSSVGQPGRRPGGGRRRND